MRAASPAALAERDGGWTCHYCDAPLAHTSNPGSYSIDDEGCLRPAAGFRWTNRDHVVPRSRGGSDHPGNLVLACSPCNGRKRDLSYLDFTGRPWRGPLQGAEEPDQTAMRLAYYEDVLRRIESEHPEILWQAIADALDLPIHAAKALR